MQQTNFKARCERAKRFNKATILLLLAMTGTFSGYVFATISKVN